MTKKDAIDKLILSALVEDIGQGDLTTAATIDKQKTGLARIIAKQSEIAIEAKMIMVNPAACERIPSKQAVMSKLPPKMAILSFLSAISAKKKLKT